MVASVEALGITPQIQLVNCSNRYLHAPTRYRVFRYKSFWWRRGRTTSRGSDRIGYRVRAYRILIGVIAPVDELINNPPVAENTPPVVPLMVTDSAVADELQKGALT